MQAAATWGGLAFLDEDAVENFDFKKHAESLKQKVAPLQFSPDGDPVGDSKIKFVVASGHTRSPRL